MLDNRNDSDVDVLVNCVNDAPQLLRCDQSPRQNWIKIKTVGVKFNRSGIGARVRGSRYISQPDLRVHFGLEKATKAEIEMRWPSGTIDRFSAKANQKGDEATVMKVSQVF